MSFGLQWPLESLYSDMCSVSGSDSPCVLVYNYKYFQVIANFYLPQQQQNNFVIQLLSLSHMSFVVVVRCRLLTNLATVCNNFTYSPDRSIYMPHWAPALSCCLRGPTTIAQKVAESPKRKRNKPTSNKLNPDTPRSLQQFKQIAAGSRIGKGILKMV